jgi:hypothetical protein
MGSWGKDFTPKTSAFAQHASNPLRPLRPPRFVFPFLG